ncbi:oligosaccharide flippase family protein [Natronorubrum sp. JWXQ-INN-674]|uniref:Oligosaccharide flippase family protein n=1 Tax=Natronorubrum halalkaliphilum TaxID=2691917 RepID=A0A6B0VNU3_9EURY|nr:flippase [Natronorubrum halalkaliphilum]MXV63310.1 oligosaccharide flippase family protein [Natronorubrum halalkaliphilum]
MSLSRIVRGVKATFGAEILRLVAQAGIILLLTRVFLSPSEYGLIFLAISIFSLTTLVATLGIPKSTAKFLTEYRSKDESQIRYILRSSIAFNAVTVGIVCVAFYVLADTIAAVYDEPALEPLLALGVAYIIIKVAHGYLLIAFQGFGKVPLTAATSTVSSVGHLGFITLFLAFGFGTVGALAGYVAGYAIAVGVGGLLLYRIVSTYPRTDSPESGLRRRIFEYSIPLTASQAGNLLYKRVDTLMVGFFLTPLAVGLYELAKQVSTFVIAPADSLGFTVAPMFGEDKSANQLDHAARVYEQSLKYVLLLYIPAVAGLVLLADPAIRFIFGAEYADAALVLQIFSVFVLFQAIDKITNDSLDYLGRATERAIGKGVTGTLNFGLNLALIPTIGVEGAALSTSLCFGLMVLYNIYLMDREVSLDWGRIAKFSTGAIAITTVMVAIVSVLEPYVDGIVSLFAVVAAGVLVWALTSVVSGFVDPQEVRAHI